MNSASLLQEGRVEEALAALKFEVRQAPSEVDLRVRLFAVHCVLGHWEKAAADLDAVQSLDPTWTLPAQVYRSLLLAEDIRRSVFAGRARPLVMGEPPAWLAWNVQALELEADGKAAEAEDLRTQAWGAAPDYACTVDGQACRWLADTDRRLGPVLEAVLEGKYYWIPFGQLVRWEVTPPEFLVEAVWVPARLTVHSGTELAAHLPARYPGTESSGSGSLWLGQTTEWREGPGGVLRPVGQKLLESEDATFGLLAFRSVEFQTPAPTG